MERFSYRIGTGTDKRSITTEEKQYVSPPKPHTKKKNYGAD